MRRPPSAGERGIEERRERHRRERHRRERHRRETREFSLASSFISIHFSPSSLELETKGYLKKSFTEVV